MTQSDNWPTTNGNGALVRGHLNENDLANATDHKGPTPPGYAASAGFTWLDDSADPVWALRVYIGGTVSNLANWPVVWSFNRTTGAFGLGTAPGAPLHVARLETTYAGSLAETVSRAAALFKTHGTDTTVFSFGVLTAGAGYIQRSNGAGSMAADLALNPHGGNLLVGATGNTMHTIQKAVSAGAAIMEVRNPSVTAMGVSAADATGASGTASVVGINKNNTTNRSVNAAGTINASGADYAEYVRKASACGGIFAGQVCGVNGAGELTDQFDLAHSFVIKSTDPAYVGGDTWGSEDVIGARPAEPHPDNVAFEAPPVPEGDFDLDAWQVEYEAARQAAVDAAMASYQADLAAWEAVLEAERVKFDRIAFSGQVPVNHTGAGVGEYLVPVRNPDGSIGTEAKAMADMTMADYARAVGKVWKILPDGRAWVKVG